MKIKIEKDISRCFWANTKNPLYVAYHDEEWGVPCHDERMLFEMLILEGFQAGLSWECVLNKREAFREAFDNFDVHKIVGYDEAKQMELAANPGIIRNRLKIGASVVNARAFIGIQEEYGSFNKYIWGFTEGKVIYEPCNLRTTSPLSDTISKDLRKRGMKFVGSTVIYSYLQAIGVINGHLEGCCRYTRVSLHCF
ncbi:MAG: DNA-3-methyladenine glycosylase I [Bacteroidales bacterium]|nr:DNA-3-methyladenine glycosylase I [Bacteroidales bacterium]